jgi:uncharacterized protein (DUF488 family)
VSPPEILTVGHSTHSEQEFLSLLRGHGIEALADVRRFPSSRRLSHFNAAALERALGEAGVEYARLGDKLGGRRSAAADSPNAGWRVPGFRGYADHMATPEFARALEALDRLGNAKRTAFMCAEGPWWRCHRQLVADALLVRGWSVVHVMPNGRLDAHRLTPFAVVEGERLTYPPEQPTLADAAGD